MSRFPPAVWQTAESMHITGFRFARGIVGKPPFPSNNLRELKVSYSYVPSVGDKPFQVHMICCPRINKRYCRMFYITCFKHIYLVLRKHV